MIDVKDKELLLTQSKSKTVDEWVEYFENRYTRRQIYEYLHRNNLPFIKLKGKGIPDSTARKWHINQNYFKTWSHNMAYILGLWYADGCIYRGKMFDITLHKKDKYILQRIAEELEYEGPLYDYVDRQAARLNFSCVVIYQDIVALGGKECKSLDICFPESIPEEYLHDFIRGYFDGDGSIMKMKHNRINSAFTSGSKEFLDQLLKILQEKAGVKGGSYDTSCMSLKFGKKDSIAIGKYMYKDNPELFLKRKRDKFPI